MEREEQSGERGIRVDFVGSARSKSHSVSSLFTLGGAVGNNRVPVKLEGGDKRSKLSAVWGGWKRQRLEQSRFDKRYYSDMIPVTTSPSSSQGQHLQQQPEEDDRGQDVSADSSHRRLFLKRRARNSPEKQALTQGGPHNKYNKNRRYSLQSTKTGPSASGRHYEDVRSSKDNYRRHSRPLSLVTNCIWEQANEPSPGGGGGGCGLGAEEPAENEQPTTAAGMNSIPSVLSVHKLENVSGYKQKQTSKASDGYSQQSKQKGLASLRRASMAADVEAQRATQRRGAAAVNIHRFPNSLSFYEQGTSQQDDQLGSTYSCDQWHPQHTHSPAAPPTDSLRGRSVDIDDEDGDDDDDDENELEDKEQHVDSSSCNSSTLSLASHFLNKHNLMSEICLNSTSNPPVCSTAATQNGNSCKVREPSEICEPEASTVAPCRPTTAVLSKPSFPQCFQLD